MRRFLGLALAVGLWLGHAPAAKAQFGVYVNTPYTSVGVGSPYGVSGVGMYPYGYVNPYSGVVAPYGGVTTGYVAPGITNYYSSGYSGITPMVAPYSYGYSVYGPRYGPAPYVYRSYGYGPYYGRGGLGRGAFRRGGYW